MIQDQHGSKTRANGKAGAPIAEQVTGKTTHRRVLERPDALKMTPHTPPAQSKAVPVVPHGPYGPCI